METETTRILSTGKKVALWLAIIWLAFCLLGAIGNGWYFVIVICVALITAIFCLLKNILNAKYTWAIFAISLILPPVMSGAMADSEGDSAKIEAERVDEPKDAAKTENTKESKNGESGEEAKKEKPKLSAKEQEVADAGFKKGSMFGMAGASIEDFSTMLDLADYVDGMEEEVNKLLERMAGQEYDNEYNVPTNAEEQKLKRIYIESFIKAMNGTMDTMDALDKLGGKR